MRMPMTMEMDLCSLFGVNDQCVDKDSEFFVRSDQLPICIRHTIADEDTLACSKCGADTLRDILGTRAGVTTRAVPTVDDIKEARERFFAVAFLKKANRERYGEIVKKIQNDYLMGGQAGWLQ